MSNNAGALLGGLLVGGLVVGAAMSADNAAKRQNQRNYPRYNHQHHHQHHHQPELNATYCICGAAMVQGTVQQGVAKCNNLNCLRVLTGSVMYYCPNGGNVQQHRNGFFYCLQCAQKMRGGVKVIRKPAVVQKQNIYPAHIKQNVYPVQKQANTAIVVKQGYMSKRGNWLNTAFKKRYFKLWSNRKMAYFTHPGASYTKGYADFTKIKKMEKKGNHGFEVVTAEREWSFLCQSQVDRDDWFRVIQSICTDVKPQQPQYVPAQQQVYAPKPQVQYVPAPVTRTPPNYLQPGSGVNNEIQPGMVGYNVGDMYGNGGNEWEEKAPPAAFYDPMAPSAPPVDEIVPSAPPMDEDQNEGAYTKQ